MTSIDENSVVEPLDEAVSLSGVRLLEEREIYVFGQLSRHGRKLFFKGVNPRYKDVPRALSLLRKEYDLGMRLEHPGIVRFISLEVIPGVGEAILMEWIEGMTLSHWMQQNPSCKKRVQVARQIIDALSYMAHKGVAHRDLKPDNIMVRSRDGSVCLIDFGHGDSDDFVTHKVAAGTVRFGAPEQRDHNVSDAAADVYSLGKILEFLSLPSLYRPIIKACLKTNPVDRPDIDTVKKHFMRVGVWPIVFVPVLLFVAVTIVCVVLAVSSEGPATTVETRPTEETSVPPICSEENNVFPTVEAPEVATDVVTAPETKAPVGNVSETNAAGTADNAEGIYQKALAQTDALLRQYDEQFRRIREVDYSSVSQEEFLKFTQDVYSREGEAFGNLFNKMVEEMRASGVPAEEISGYLNKLLNYHRDKVEAASGLSH